MPEASVTEDQPESTPAEKPLPSRSDVYRAVAALHLGSDCCYMTAQRVDELTPQETYDRLWAIQSQVIAAMKWLDHDLRILP